MATEKRLIDANVLLVTLSKKAFEPIYQHNGEDYFVGVADACGMVTETPTVDAVEVVHGEWDTIEDDYTGMIALQCSECSQEYWFEDEPPLKIYNYCPNCGAKMDGDNK
jgi:DNA-directed RNA polymerase subunit RPC12/RpoP